MAQFEHIWREQCAATDTIRSRHGERAALDYLVGEKLLLYTSTARTRPEFAAQLPAFVTRVREMFPRKVITSYIEELEARLTEESHQVDTEDVFLETTAVSDLTSLFQIADLLRVESLGTA
jgi:hypothetical protein